MIRCPSCGQPLAIRNLVFEKSMFASGQEKTPHELCGALVPDELVMAVLLDKSDEELLRELNQRSSG